ncbi:MAG TPA: hypothetical protein DEQ02_10885 [Ruminococcaceae bacterium]|nr:hypothetical protein [Oscillospiraceae bacterium]
MKVLYITDLDGTLLNKKQKVSEKSREILNRLLADGLLFSVATARSPVSTLPLLEGINIRLPLVLMNGVMLYDAAEKKAIEIKAIERDTACRTIDIFERCGCPPYVYGYDDGIYLEYKKIHRPESAAFFSERREGYKRLERCSEYDLSRPVIYINMMGEERIMSEIKNKLRDVSGIRYAYYPDNYDMGLWFLEVFGAGADKGLGAARLAEITGAERIAAFGDNYNDLPLLEKADLSFAPAGSPEEVRSAADAVIAENDRDSVAKCIETLYKVYGGSA